MKSELHSYELSPKLVPTGKSTKVTIRPLGRHAAFDADKEYILRFASLSDTGGPKSDKDLETMVVKPVNGTLLFERVFRGEQEHAIRIFDAAEPQKLLVSLSVFSLQPDLYSRFPYKGDLHLHSSETDGREVPEVVAAHCRKIGYDFCAITDHMSIEPARQAIEAFKGLNIDLAIYLGEEVHAHNNHIHIVNFGCDNSVNELIKSNINLYLQDIADFIKNNDIPKDVNETEYASYLWCCQKIRESGGLSVFVHPYWLVRTYHVEEEMARALYAAQPFDAVEIAGGSADGFINLQIAMHYEMAAGRPIPIVAGSDAHKTVNDYAFGNYFTVVFSPSLEKEDIIESIRNGYSVAVNRIGENRSRILGPLRLVKLVQFLLCEYFPLHDELCFEEGRLMKDYVCGDRRASELLSLLRGRTPAYMQHILKG